MTKRVKELRRHVAVRVVERLDGDVSPDELRRRLVNNEVEYLMRQSVTRSLCRARDPLGKWVYMIVQRKEKEVVTVLTEAQAIERLKMEGRVLP